MIRQLVLDAVRRQWRMYLMWSVQIALFTTTREPRSLYFSPLAIALAGAVLIHAGTVGALKDDVITGLPISRRTLWQAQWWLGTMVPSAFVTISSSIGLLIRDGRVDAGTMLLTLLYSVLWLGFAFWLRVTPIGLWGDGPVDVARDRRKMLLILVGTLPLMLVALGSPFLLAAFLPRRLDEVTVVWAVVLTALAILTTWAYFHQPAIKARPSMRAAKATTPNEAPAAAPAATRRIFSDRLSGLTLVVYEEAQKQFTLFATIIAVLIAGWAVASQFRPMPPLRDFLKLADALPFASPKAHVTEPITIGLLFFFTSMFGVWMLTKLRALRTLPLSSTQLAGIPVTLGVLSATMLWLVFLVLHALVLRTMPVSLRPDLFLAFAALTALSLTMRFTLPGQETSKVMLSLAPLGVIWLALGFTDKFRPDLVQPGSFIGGLLVLALSFALMRHFVTRSSRIYRQHLVGRI